MPAPVAEAMAEVRAGLAETIALEKMRGDDIAVRDGRLTLLSRDGLMSLYSRGAIETPELEAGLVYRRSYELAVGGPRCSLAAPGPHASRTSGSDSFALVKLLCAERVRRLEDYAKTDRQLAMLRLVAGEGRTVNSIAAAGSTRTANIRALNDVLRSIAVTSGLRS